MAAFEVDLKHDLMENDCRRSLNKEALNEERD
jgi:hypothetical protein